MILKIVDGSLIVWGETGYLYSLKVCSHSTPINYNGKNVNCTEKQSERRYLNQGMRINITSNEIIHTMCLLIWTEMNNFYDAPTKNLQLKSNDIRQIHLKKHFTN